MINTSVNGRPAPETNFAAHMAALEQLRRELEAGELDPAEAVERCRMAEQHYRALETILTRAEQEIEELQSRSDAASTLDDRGA